MTKIMLSILILGFSFNSYSKTVLEINDSVDDLIYIIKKNNINSIEQALASISDDFFNYNNYVLKFKSHSPQPASEKFPRIILFGENDHLRIGFNHRMGEDKDLEIIQWREDTEKWEFREIKFKDNVAHISQANPPVCLGCHGFENKKPFIDRSNVLTSMNIFSKKIDKRFFEKERSVDTVYARLKRLGL